MSTYCYAHGWQDWCTQCPPSGFPDFTAEYEAAAQEAATPEYPDPSKFGAWVAYEEGYGDGQKHMREDYVLVPRWPIVREWLLEQRSSPNACTHRLRDKIHFHIWPRGKYLFKE